MTPVMELSGIIRRYPDRERKGAFCEVLHLAHLAVDAGEILGIVGHNGCGKSTLLRIMALLEPPDDGTVLFDGAPVSSVDLAPRQRVTLLLQTPYLLSRNVRANVGYGLKVRGQHDPELVDQALRRVGLDPLLFGRRRRHELSGGEAQRVALAARLVLNPRLLLMDEPTASVDEASARLVAEAARGAAAQGSAVVIVSHDRDWLDPLATRMVKLRQGRLVE